MASAITLEEVTVAYRRHPAIHHICGSFPLGVATAVVGPNGAGKSTLLKAICGSLRLDEGRIRFGSGFARGDLGFLPQLAEIDRAFPITVAELAALGHWPRRGWLRRHGPAERDRTFRAIAQVGLAGFEDRLIGTLSAGQLQRALFARLMVQDARIVLLDEPFAALDSRTTTDLLALMRRWHCEERRTVIAVLHDLEAVREHFPETLILAREQVAWGPTATVLSADTLREARRMAEVWDETARPCARLPAAA